MKRVLGAFLAAALMLAARNAGAATIRVFAASSLTEAFQDLATLYESRNEGTDVELNFAGSQILRVQIDEGADADVFASADRVQMDALRSKGAVGPDSVFARNRLVAITPREGAKIHDLGDFARPGLRLVICDANVPVGRYTTQVLGKMNRGGLFGDDYQKRVMANVVSQETNVRAVLGKVSLNEVDGGFVYATDAQTAPEKIVALPIPDRLNVIAEYPIAVLAKSANEDGAAAFVALVLSAEGQSLLAKRGFQPPR